MTDESKNPIIAICYSLPHVILASSSIIFLFYLGLLYINTYKWRSKDFGKACSLYFLSMSISQLTVGLVVQFAGTNTNEVKALRNCKIIQITNIVFNAVSLFLLIFLPILRSLYEKYANESQEEVESSKGDILLTCWKQFLHGLSPLFVPKTSFFITCFLSLLNGYSWGVYDIYDNLIQTFITRDLAYLSSTNTLVRSLSALSVSLLVLFLIRFYRQNCPDYINFLGLGVLLLLFLPPISFLFFTFTEPFKGSVTPSYIVPASAKPDFSTLIGLSILETVSTVLLLSFPSVLQYMSKNLGEYDEDFRIYGITFFFISFFVGTAFYRVFNRISKIPKRCISYMSIAFHSVGYLFLFPFKWFLYKGGLLYYLLIAVFGVFNRTSFTNSNLFMSSLLIDDNHRKYRWVIQGVIGSIKNIVLFFLIFLIYWTYDKEKCQSGKDVNTPSGHSFCAESTQEGVDGFGDVSKGDIESGNGNVEGDKVKGGTASLDFRTLFIVIYLTCQIASAIALFLLRKHVPI